MRFTDAKRNESGAEKCGKEVFVVECGHMTKLLEHAIKKVKGLSAEEQNMAAEVLMTIIHKDETSYRLTDKQIAEVKRTQKEVRKGKFATARQVSALWKKFGA